MKRTDMARAKARAFCVGADRVRDLSDAGSVQNGIRSEWDLDADFKTNVETRPLEASRFVVAACSEWNPDARGIEVSTLSADLASGITSASGITLPTGTTSGRPADSDPHLP